jgi:aryl-alcohol dehydrogenase-like predicted oxidoreductase
LNAVHDFSYSVLRYRVSPDWFVLSVDSARAGTSKRSSQDLSVVEAASRVGRDLSRDPSALAAGWLLVVRRGVIAALMGAGALGILAAVAGWPIGR